MDCHIHIPGVGQWTQIIGHDGEELVFVPKGARIIGPSADSLSQLPAATGNQDGHTCASVGVESDNVVDAGNESGNAKA